MIVLNMAVLCGMNHWHYDIQHNDMQ